MPVAARRRSRARTATGADARAAGTPCRPRRAPSATPGCREATPCIRGRRRRGSARARRRSLQRHTVLRRQRAPELTADVRGDLALASAERLVAEDPVETADALLRLDVVALLRAVLDA